VRTARLEFPFTSLQVYTMWRYGVIKSHAFSEGAKCAPIMSAYLKHWMTVISPIDWTLREWKVPLASFAGICYLAVQKEHRNYIYSDDKGSLKSEDLITNHLCDHQPFSGG
jgi:hypothetical protein